MADLPEEKKSGLSILDTALIAGAIVAGIFIFLWIARAVLGVALWFFKVAILVVIVAVIVRLVHHFSRSKD
jgi:type IV secretory pathway TrbD component